MDKILSKYDFRTTNVLKQLSNKKPYKTPRMADRVLNVKLGSHKKSNGDLRPKYKSIHNTITNSSFCSKKLNQGKKNEMKRKKSSSSSPDIRTTPNSTLMAKKLSKNDFGYVNPKRKSYNNNSQLKKLYEKKYQLPSKTTAASIKSSALGSGRSSVMSSLAKAGNKYRNINTKNSQSFIEQVTKGIKTNSSDNYKSVVTRNIPKEIKEQKSKLLFSFPYALV